MRILAPLAGFILVLHATFAFAAPLTLSPFVTGLESPIDIVNAADGSGRLFVLEKRGRIRVVRNGALVATPMLDIEDIVLGGEERGLLGIAFHPRFATTRYLYVNYTRVPDGATVVERYTVPADTPDVADPASGRRCW
jgi:glucose/arabinose dehydrogenase